MSNLQVKREEFRKYLDRCGVIDSLTKAITQLYSESEKPEDAVQFVRQKMCVSCTEEAEEAGSITEKYAEALRTIEQLEEEIEYMRGNLELSPSKTELALGKGFESLQSDENCESLLKKYLTKEVFTELSSVKTSSGATLLHVIQSGLDNHDSSVGVYAADKESYDVFKPLLHKIIIEYHKLDEAEEGSLQKPLDWGDIDTIENLDPDNKFIISTRIRIARSVEGYPFFARMSEEQFSEMENTVKNVVENLEGEHSGVYQTIKEISPEEQEKMVERQLLFKKNDPYLKSAGCYRFWSKGRGVFHNKEETFIVWVNEEDHLRIMSKQKGGDLGQVYKRLVSGVKIIEENIKFDRHDSYGFVTSCPTNLGTTMRASVHIKLPKLSRNMEEFEQKCESMNLQIRGTRGEHSEIEAGVMDISVKKRMGITEYDVIKLLQDNILVLINEENQIDD